MSAREEFEAIRADVLSLETRRRDAARLRAQTEPHGQRFGSMGHGGGGADFTAASVEIMELENALEVEQAQLFARIERAERVLYGSDGRGGLAQVAGNLCADSIHGYYLQGMTWAEVGHELTADSADPAQFARFKAMRGLRVIDIHGAAHLSQR